MRVLLCLISKQHVPNLLSVHHYRPDQLVLIQSKSMERGRAAGAFLEALRLGGQDYSNRHHIEKLDAEDDMGAVQSALQNAFNRFPSAEWIANLTGGNKPMSIAAYEFFEGRGKRIYSNPARPARFLDMDGGPAEEGDHRLSIKEFLAGYGFRLTKSDKDLAEAEDRARKWARSARLLARRARATGLLDISHAEQNQAREKGIELNADRFDLRDEELQAEWVGDAETRKLDKYEARFLTGEWLEVFFWNILTDHAQALDIWDVRLGPHIQYGEHGPSNDLDVAFMHDHRLAVMECKSGSQRHDPNADALYKLETVVRQVRALRVRSYLASTSNNLFNPKKLERGIREVKKGLRNRAAFYGCRILARDQIRELAAHADDAEKVREILFDKPRDNETRA